MLSWQNAKMVMERYLDLIDNNLSALCQCTTNVLFFVQSSYDNSCEANPVKTLQQDPGTFEMKRNGFFEDELMN